MFCTKCADRGRRLFRQSGDLPWLLASIRYEQNPKLNIAKSAHVVARGKGQRCGLVVLARGVLSPPGDETAAGIFTERADSVAASNCSKLMARGLLALACVTGTTGLMIAAGLQQAPSMAPQHRSSGAFRPLHPTARRKHGVAPFRGRTDSRLVQRGSDYRRRPLPNPATTVLRDSGRIAPYSDESSDRFRPHPHFAHRAGNLAADDVSRRFRPLPRVPVTYQKRAVSDGSR